MADWTREVTEDMLPESHRQIADVIGVEAMIKLCETYGGLTISVPKEDAIRRIQRDRRIRAEYNGVNTNQLAREYGLTTRSIRNMMANAYGAATLPEIGYSVKIEHLYPIQDDEEDERARDLDEVSRQARSKLSYIRKWQPLVDAEGELEQIQAEQRQADAFGASMARELSVT